MYWRYSLIVVAPTTLICPLAKAGLRRFPISIAHWVLQVQTTKWSSSIKRIISQSDFSTSFKTAFKRSSNSHWYFAPAIKDHISSSIIFLFFNISGTSHLTICCAKSSIIAVFQTPGSHIKTGLFFVLRDKIWIVLLVSSSLQITGSNFHSSANWVISLPYFDKASIVFSGFCDWIFSQFLISVIALKTKS